MHFFSFSAFVALAACVSGVKADAPEAKGNFLLAHIPADLHISFQPKGTLNVIFNPPVDVIPTTSLAASHAPSSTQPQPTTLKMIEPVAKKVTEHPPTFQVSAELGKGPFVIALVDPDITNVKTDGQYRHFLGGGFVLDADGTTLKSNTPAITEYLAPNPKDGSRIHRYTFLLYNQPEGFETQTEISALTSRDSFFIHKFAEKVKLGDPVAGTFMMIAEFDIPVPHCSIVGGVFHCD